jgi:N-acetylglutamate synthase-like GNAT family acetyltransferase
MLNIKGLNGNVDGRVRHATSSDIPAIARLMLRAQAEDGAPRIAESEIAELMTRGEIIVLGVQPDELVAAACLVAAASRAHLAFVVVEPGVAGLETRIRSVAASLSEAMRCEPRFAQPHRRAS